MTDYLALIPASLGSWLGFGAAAGGGFGAIKWLAEHIGGRMDRRADRLDADTRFVIENLKAEVARLSARVGVIEEDLRECTKKHAEAEARVMQLEAMQAGLGDARQHAALIVAAEKRKGADGADGR